MHGILFEQCFDFRREERAARVIRSRIEVSDRHDARFTVLVVMKPRFHSLRAQAGGVLLSSDSALRILDARDQPMDHTSTEGAFAVRSAAGATVRGTFAWTDEDSILTFKAAQQLPLNTDYSATLATSAHGLGGGGALSEALQFPFKSAPAPAVISSLPLANAIAVDPASSIQIGFAGLMDPETFKAQVHVSPAPADLNDWYSEYDNTYYLGFSLKALTAYTVVLDAGLADPSGNTLGKPYTLNFTTGSQIGRAHV